MKKDLEDKIDMDCTTCVFKIDYIAEDGMRHYCYIKGDIDMDNPTRCEDYEFDGFP